MSPCHHEKKKGRTRCNECHARYMRWLRDVSEPRKIAQARREGRADAFRIVRISLLEVGDKALTGFTAAELIRKIGLD